MKKLVLIGGGGHCKSVLDAAVRLHEYSKIVITDPDIEKGTIICDHKVVGDDDMLESLYDQGFKYAFITVGSIKNANVRIRLMKIAKKIGYIFPVIIDPSAVISTYVDIGEGTFVGKNAVLNAGSRIGSHCIINTGSIIEHDCVVNDFTHISVGAILCGGVSVGKKCFVGAGSVIIQSNSIDDNVIIGADSLVLNRVSEGNTVYGIVNKKNGAKNE